MKQTDSLKRIDMPNENKENRYVNYENKLKPMLDFENEELKSLYFQHEQQLLAMAEKEAWDYLVDFVAWSVSSTMIQKWILLFLIVLIHLRFSKVRKI